MNNTTTPASLYSFGPKYVYYDFGLFEDYHFENQVLFNYSRLPENQSPELITKESFWSNKPDRTVLFSVKDQFLQVTFGEHMYTFKVKLQHEVNNLCSFFDL